MNNERTYIYYRNRRVPGWWIDYLPEEKNPYNIFLDNQIGKLKLTKRKGAGMGSWRGRYL